MRKFIIIARDLHGIRLMDSEYGKRKATALFNKVRADFPTCNVTLKEVQS